jgi:hypothetical protein
MAKVDIYILTWNIIHLHDVELTCQASSYCNQPAVHAQYGRKQVALNVKVLDYLRPAAPKRTQAQHLVLLVAHRAW